MLRLNQKITINSRTLPLVSNVEIKTTRNDFTDTAIISFPNRLSERGTRISDAILKGSRVVIELGYFPNLVTEFEGYVSQVIPEKTIVIKCENEAYNLKRRSVGRDIILKKTTINELVSTIYSGDFIAETANIGDWKISKTSTIISVLSELQNKYRIYSYFRGSTLIVGATVDPRVKQNVPLHFQRNIPIGESSFNFKDAGADAIVVKATTVSRNGKLTEIYAYYEQENIVFAPVAPAVGSINEFNIGGQNGLTDITQEDLQRLASQRLEALSFTGVDGSITTYGKPSAAHGDIAIVTDSDVPEKSGRYAIVEIIKRFGIGVGYRQDISLGLNLQSNG